jgi:hypothetical protein
LFFRNKNHNITKDKGNKWHCSLVKLVDIEMKKLTIGVLKNQWKNKNIHRKCSYIL